MLSSINCLQKHYLKMNLCLVQFWNIALMFFIYKNLHIVPFDFAVGCVFKG